MSVRRAMDVVSRRVGMDCDFADLLEQRFLARANVLSDSRLSLLDRRLAQVIKKFDMALECNGTHWADHRYFVKEAQVDDPLEALDQSVALRQTNQCLMELEIFQTEWLACSGGFVDRLSQWP